MVDIEPMKVRHLRGVVAIENQTSGHPWSLRLFESELRQTNSRCFVALAPHSVVVGFGCLLTTGFETHVTNIAVAPQFQRHGIGQQLLCRLVDESIALGLQEVTLEVRATNASASRLYERFGFVEEGVRPKYYADTGEDAIIMWLRGLLEPAVQARLASLREK